MSTQSSRPCPRTMSPGTAQYVTSGIIAFCLASLALVFQPFWLPLYSAGCIMVVIGCLVFNLMPFATTQNPLQRLFRVLAIVLAILVIAVLAVIGFVEIAL